MQPLLSTPRLVLRSLQEADVQQLFELRSNPAMSLYINRAVSSSIEEVQTFIERISKNANEGAVGYWAITLQGDDRLIGTACVFNISNDHHRAEVGYELLPAYQGKGYMIEAVGAVVQYCFEQLNLHSLEAVVDPANTPSVRLLEKSGFVREALFKDKEFYKGGYRDLAVYSKINPAH